MRSPPCRASYIVCPGCRCSCYCRCRCCTCAFVSRFPGLRKTDPRCLTHFSYLADEMQLADELPMIYTVCIMGFATFSYRRPAKVQALIAAGLVGLAVFITVWITRYLYPFRYRLADMPLFRSTTSLPRTRSSTRLRTASSLPPPSSAASTSWKNTCGRS